MATLTQGAAPNVVSANIYDERGPTILSLALSPSAVSANTTAEQTFTATGVAVGDVVVCINKPTAQAGLGIVGFRVTAANTIGITFSNNTGAGITPTAAETYLVGVYRPAYNAAKTSFEG